MKLALISNNKKESYYIMNIINKKHIELNLSCENFEETQNFFNQIQKVRYDIIILDYPLDCSESFELAIEISETMRNSFIIFISPLNSIPHNNYIFHSFKFIARENLYNEFANTLDNAVHYILENKNKLIVKSHGNIFTIIIEEIYGVYSEISYLNIHLKDSTIRTRMKFKDIDQLLISHGFVHTKSNTLVNVYKIKSIQKDSVLMSNGRFYYLSRSGYKELKSKYKIN